MYTEAFNQAEKVTLEPSFEVRCMVPICSEEAYHKLTLQTGPYLEGFERP